MKKRMLLILAIGVMFTPLSYAVENIGAAPESIHGCPYLPVTVARDDSQSASVHKENKQENVVIEVAPSGG